MRDFQHPLRALVSFIILHIFIFVYIDAVYFFMYNFFSEFTHNLRIFFVHFAYFSVVLYNSLISQSIRGRLFPS